MRCRFAIQCFTGPYCVNQSLSHTYIYEETSLEIDSSRDDIILILIVGYVCYITIASGSSQHSAVALFNLYVAASERIVTWMRFRSMLLKWGTL